MALVAADGTIDWWCPGRFDAPAALFRLLDPEGGAVRVGPATPAPVVGTQSYDRGTNVLRTVLPTGDGELEVVDFMPWRGDRGRALDGRIVRLLTARRGRVEVDVEVQPGAAFGPAKAVHPWSAGIAFDGVAVHTGCDMESRSGRLVLEPGEQAVVVVSPLEADARPEGLSLAAAHDLLDRTTTAWRSHLGPLTYDGPYRADVERSLLLLKSLTYGPTGTVVAAGTTSLPEVVGGERNWDYRFSWVRDASLAIAATYDAGLREEAEYFNDWLLRVLQRGAFPLRPVYDVDGSELDPDGEVELALAGWSRSRPVRVGNAASDHLQLDFYADLVSAIHVEQFRADTSRVEALWRPLARMADWLTEAWRQPDRGIWELRTPPRQLVSSKLACWYALDRMVELSRARDILDLDAVGWRAAANEIKAWLTEHGTAADGSLRADDSSADRADGALVQLAWRDPFGDPTIVQRTIDRTIERLGAGPFVRRYDADFDDGFAPERGGFLACSFWMVEALATVGRWDEAHERMEALCAHGRPLGLLPEQIDPNTGEYLGNLPQALSHLTLIQAALALARGPA
jgi:GH15 family glucan-1,4-alpha-glucosidase